jgi:hypothetical protein
MRTEIKIGLAMAGMPENTIADIEKSLPALLRLLAAYEKLSPELALLKPDLDQVAPVLVEVINFVKGE